MFNKKFKVGDRVKLTDEAYNDSPNLETEYKMSRDDVFTVVALDFTMVGFRYAKLHDVIGYFDNDSCVKVNKPVIICLTKE